MTNLSPISANELRAGLADGRYRLVDIRERDEFARVRIDGAINCPLSEWQRSPRAFGSDREIVFACRSGARTRAACGRLAAELDGPARVLDGGIDGWRRAGLPVASDPRAPLEIMRQVQIAAGSLVLLGLLLGWVASPLWFGLAAFVGAGLTFAGLSGFCGMARLLMLAPWNRRAAG